jgi:hypothetical protein
MTVKEKETRLAAVRKQIEEKEAELRRLRDEESVLVKELVVIGGREKPKALEIPDLFRDLPAEARPSDPGDAVVIARAHDWCKKNLEGKQVKVKWPIRDITLSGDVEGAFTARVQSTVPDVKLFERRWFVSFSDSQSGSDANGYFLEFRKLDGDTASKLRKMRNQMVEVEAKVERVIIKPAPAGRGAQSILFYFHEVAINGLKLPDSPK